jgi:Protein of unknown function (DUF4087)
MLRPLLLSATLLAALPAQAETRCGWYLNNTSASIYLEDADDLWVIWEQGGVLIPTADDAYPPDFRDRVVMDYGGNIVVSDYAKHGFSCVCVEGAFGDVGSGKIKSITRFKPLPIAQCEDDPNLPKIQLSGQ